MRELTRYVGNGYRATNHRLRGNLLGAINAAVRTLDRELEHNGSPLPGGTTLYRIGGAVADFAEYGAAPGVVFSDRAYLSSSGNEANYGWHCKHAVLLQTLFITINCLPRGFARYIGGVCVNRQEMEVLFHRNVNFRISATETDANENVHWTMDEIDSPNAGYVWGAAA